MASLNQVQLIGNLTRDPELRVTPKGTTICTFSIAVNRKFKDEGGGEREEVTYLDCEAWGKTGEAVSKYCTKGRPVFVGGRLKLEQWEDKNTKEKRSRIKVVAENVQFLGGREDAAPREGSGHRQPPPVTGGRTPDNSNLDEENVPF